MPRPVARAPFKAVPRWTEMLETELQKVMLAGQSGDQQRITTATTSVASRTLADTGGRRGHAGRTGGRIDGLEDAEGPSADADNPTSASAPHQPPSDTSRYMAAHMADAAAASRQGTSALARAMLTPHRELSRSPSLPQTKAEAQRMAARLQYHLAYGAAGRAARSLAPTSPVELNDDNIRKLHVLHPVETHNTPPPRCLMHCKSTRRH